SPAESIGRVREVDERAGNVSFLNRRGQFRHLPAADAVDEVGEMIAAGFSARAGALAGTEPALVAEGVLVAGREVAVRPVEDAADRIVAIEEAAAEACLVVRDPMPDLELHHLATAARLVEFERAVEDVRRLLIVVEHEVAADGGDPGRERDAKPPSRGIHLVDALVAKVTVAGVPEPVPVVVKAVPCERLRRRGSGPEVI